MTKDGKDKVLEVIDIIEDRCNDIGGAAGHCGGSEDTRALHDDCVPDRKRALKTKHGETVSVCEGISNDVKNGLKLSEMATAAVLKKKVSQC